MCVSHTVQHIKTKIWVLLEYIKFSFYYAHHMSTIEGGMICTNNKNIYELSKNF